MLDKGHPRLASLSDPAATCRVVINRVKELRVMVSHSRVSTSTSQLLYIARVSGLSTTDDFFCCHFCVLDSSTNLDFCALYQLHLLIHRFPHHQLAVFGFSFLFGKIKFLVLFQCLELIVYINSTGTFHH